MTTSALSKTDERTFVALVDRVDAQIIFDEMCSSSGAGDQEEEQKQADMKGFEAALTKHQVSLDKFQLFYLFSKIDEDSNGTISQEEFQAYLSLMQATSIFESIKKMNEQSDRTANAAEKSSKITRIGGVFMKVKLILGFSQVVSNLSVSFDIVPWPKDFTGLMKFLELASADLMALLGETACQLQTGFLSKFNLHMALIPSLLGTATAAYAMASCRAPYSSKFTRESARTQCFNIVSFFMFTAYIGVSTRIFRLFRCREIMSVWYLVEDMSVTCFESSWNNAAGLAYVCIVLFVVGIPLVQFLALCWNRKYLDESQCLDVKARRRHMQVKRKFGSIFDAYTPQYYYFDLIDLLRRLLLSGGLAIAGSNQAVAQLLLGILVSALWLFSVLYLRPYKSTWDTLLSSVLAFVVVLTLACGMALKLYQFTVDGSDEYQQSLFGVVLTTTVVITIVCGVVAIVLSFDCMSGRMIKCLDQTKNSNPTKTSNPTQVTPGSTTPESVSEHRISIANTRQ